MKLCFDQINTCILFLFVLCPYMLVAPLWHENDLSSLSVQILFRTGGGFRGPRNRWCKINNGVCYHILPFLRSRSSELKSNLSLDFEPEIRAIRWGGRYQFVRCQKTRCARVIHNPENKLLVMRHRRGLPEKHESPLKIMTHFFWGEVWARPLPP